MIIAACAAITIGEDLWQPCIQALPQISARGEGSTARGHLYKGQNKQPVCINFVAKMNPVVEYKRNIWVHLPQDNSLHLPALFILIAVNEAGCLTQEVSHFVILVHTACQQSVVPQGVHQYPCCLHKSHHKK